MVQTFQILVFFCRFVGKQLRFQVVVANHTNWEVKISKKNDGFGTLSNNCTLLWRQANYEIEMLKTKASRPLLELSMQKIHATVAPDSSCWDSRNFFGSAEHCKALLHSKPTSFLAMCYFIR